MDTQKQNSIIYSYQQGVNTTYILDHFGISYPTLYKILHENQIPMRGRGNRTTTINTLSDIEFTIRPEVQSYSVRMIIDVTAVGKNLEDAVDNAEAMVPFAITEVISVSRRE